MCEKLKAGWEGGKGLVDGLGGVPHRFEGDGEGNMKWVGKRRRKSWARKQNLL